MENRSNHKYEEWNNLVFGQIVFHIEIHSFRAGKKMIGAV